MPKKLLLYIAFFLLLVLALLFFNSAYKELNAYSELTNRHNSVHIAYQQLQKHVTHAAIMHPNLNRAYEPAKYGRLYYTDSLLVIQHLVQLTTAVRDSVNKGLAAELDRDVRQELPWLLASNVPDSIIKQQGTAHLRALERIESNIEDGIRRTAQLIDHRKIQLHNEIDRVRILMITFIILSGILLFYTSWNYFQQQSRRRDKEKELDKSLKETTDYKFALDESSIVAITDQKGIIKYVNDNFCRISKYTAGELIGKDHRIINSGYHSKEFIRNLWVTIAGGKIWKGELKNRAKDGTIYWVDTTIVPFLNEQNKPYQYVAIRADITERKLAEEKLRESEAIYRTIASSIPGSVICLLDRDYRYLLVEGDMIEKLGYSKQMLLGNKAEDVLKPERFAEVRKDLEKAFNGNTVTREVSRLGFDIISRFIPLKNEDGKVSAVMTVALDITELKNAQRDIVKLNQSLEEKVAQRTMELRQTNKELEDFSYSVSHDLRSPLRVIDGFSQILLEDHYTTLETEGRDTLQVIIKNTRKMGQLIDDLLNFSRMGRAALKISEFDMNSIVEEVLHDLKAAGNPVPANITIQKLGKVQADASLIKQVWINLISNAIKYSSAKAEPAIEIGRVDKEGKKCFFIKDNGAGFNMKFADKLFGVFQRLHKETDFPGTGVGLALVKRIVVRHGGEIGAEAKEHEGAMFYFSLHGNNGNKTEH